MKKHYLSIFCGSVLATLGGNVSADTIDNYNNSWVGQAWEMQRELDRNAPLSEINIIGTHNSYNSEVYTNTSGIRYLDPQQKYSIKDQLRMGARFIELDVHWTTKMESLFSYPKRLLLCHGTGSHTGCSINDKYFTEGLSEIKSWLQSDEGAGEVLILYIEGHMDGHQGRAVNQINSYIGDYVYKPESSCSAIPSDLTKADILGAGKQVVIWDNQGRCNNSSYDALAYTGLGSISRVWEDATSTSALANFFTGGSDKSISSSDVKTYFKNGVNIVNLDDMTTSDGRLEAGIWSWNTNEPNDYGSGEDCAMQRSDGRWNDASCGSTKAYACKDDNGNWAVTSAQGEWTGGEAACASYGGSYAFSYPISSADNEALKTARENVGYSTVWMNLDDRDAEGYWIADDVPSYSATVGGNGGGSFDTIDAYLANTSLRISKVTIRSGSRIDKVGLTYSNGNSYSFGGGGGSQYSMSLASDEYVNKVKICEAYTSKYSADTVHFVKFTTNKGNTLSGGNSSGATCSIVVSNACVVGIHGGAGSELDRLGVLYTDAANCG